MFFVGVDVAGRREVDSNGEQLIERRLRRWFCGGGVVSLEEEDADDTEVVVDSGFEVLSLRVLRAHMAAGVSSMGFFSCGCASAQEGRGGVTGSNGLVVGSIGGTNDTCSWTGTFWGSTKTPLILSHLRTATIVGCCALVLLHEVSGCSAEFVSSEPGTKKGTKGRMDAAVLVAGAMLV